MSYKNCQQWQCDKCQKVEHSISRDILPVPPPGWQMIDTTTYVPAHVAGEGVGKAKLGPVRQVIRKVYCGECK